MTLMIKCSKCGEQKELTEFHRNKSMPKGHHAYCKVCRHGMDGERKRQHYHDNKARYKARHDKWVVDNKEKLNAYMRKWNKENKDYSDSSVRLTRSNYRARLLNATPDWVDMDKIKIIYKLAKSLEMELGIKFHVDHVHPLNGKNFSGLHTWWNLQLLPPEVNIAKSNKIENITLPRVPDNFETYLQEVENLCRTYANKECKNWGIKSS
jgi:hypothetical protein